MVNYSMKEHLLYIKRKENIFCPINFTLFHITLHVISWSATYGPPCMQLLTCSIHTCFHIDFRQCKLLFIAINNTISNIFDTANYQINLNSSTPDSTSFICQDHIFRKNVKCILLLYFHSYFFSVVAKKFIILDFIA